MAITFAQLVAPQQLTNAAAVYYTSPANTKTRVDKLTFSNPDTSAHLINVWISGSTDAKNVWSDKPIAAGQSLECTEIEGQVLVAADTLQMKADTGAKVTVVASGIQIV